MKSQISIFGQVLKLISRIEFEKIVFLRKAEYDCKGFSCWTQFVGMLFCQLGQCKSLREISDGLASTCGKLIHLGINKSPARSTLSYANNKRPSIIYEDLFNLLLKRCQALSPGKDKKFRFKNKLFSLDASNIELCLSMFDWAKYRQNKGAAKLHLLLDHDGYLPTFVHISDGKCHEVNIAQDLILPKGSIVAMDRGYCDYDLFHKWTKSGVYFVTRLKDNAAYNVTNVFGLAKNSIVLSDQHIEFTNINAKKSYPGKLRRVVVWDENNKKEIVLLSNNFDLCADTIAAIYKERWQIELFFKAIKQNLKIKTFVGTSKNAVEIQIWTALIALLLIKWLQFNSQCGWTLCRFVALLRLNLFMYRDLSAFLANPLDHTKDPPPFQMALEM